MPTHPQSHEVEVKPISRWELFLVGLITLLSFGFRFAYPERLAVEHFDEGVYASNVWFGDKKEKTYPEQQFYAPPLLPALIECAFLVSGPSNQWAMLPSQLAGALTPLMLWWLGRCWFGPVAGCIAAVLCACNEVHILLSRSALTDSLLGFWWIVVMIALREACQSGRFISSVVAGGLVGLAWWTKYNGWMPLGLALGAIVLRGAVLWKLRDSRGWSLTRTSLWGWLISATTATLIWLPWVWSLQGRGGYGAVMANHRRYLVGLGGWWSSFVRQVTQINVVAGPLSSLSLLISLILVIGWMVRQQRPLEVSIDSASGNIPPDVAAPRPTFAFGNGLFLAAGLTVVGCVWPAIGIAGLALTGLVQWITKRHSTIDQTEASSRHDLGYWLLLVWIFGLSISTPLYYPYLRLSVPWLLSSFLGAGLCWQLVARSTGRASYIVPEVPSVRSSASFPTWQLGLAISLVAILAWSGGSISGLVRGRPATVCFEDRNGLTDIARQIREIIEPSEQLASESRPAAVYVFAEPALLFQLRLAGLSHVAPASSLRFAETHPVNSPNRVFLAVGIHAMQDPDFQEQFAKVTNRLKPVGKWTWQPSLLVSLDQQERKRQEQGEVELFEVITD